MQLKTRVHTSLSYSWTGPSGQNCKSLHRVLTLLKTKNASYCTYTPSTAESLVSIVPQLNRTGAMGGAQMHNTLMHEVPNGASGERHAASEPA